MAFRLILGYDIVMEVVSSVAAFFISYYAYRAYAATGKKPFLLLLFGFMLAGAGLILDSFLISAAVFFRALGLTAMGYSAYFILTLVSYCFILGSYAADKLERSGAYAYSIFPLLGFGVLPEGVLLTLSGAIAIQLGVNFSLKRSLDSFLAFLAFILIFLSHLSFMLQALRFPGLLIAGHVFRFLGFTSLLVLLLRVVKPG